MAVATTYSSAEVGIDAPEVTVEVDVRPGLPQVLIVGLPETAVRESKDRVRAAIISSGFSFPDKRVTINLAPADLPKSSGRYDLAIAVAILSAAGDIEVGAISRYEMLGELSLTGQIRAVRGVLPAALRKNHPARNLIVPFTNTEEAALAGRDHLYVSNDLASVISHFKNDETLPRPTCTNVVYETTSSLQLSDVKGQAAAKRALTIAAAGGHNLLMIGPPGTGKTMLASRLPRLLPTMSEKEALESASVLSVSRQQLDPMSFRARPFRAPHHTTSAVALVGGSSPPRPGEISLAHNGVLFLDELPEFPRHVLEVLREPLESGEICISRAAHQVTYPAAFQLIAAMNPCPCGYYGDAAVAPGSLNQQPKSELEEDDRVADRIAASRELALERQNRLNCQLDEKDISKHCNLKEPDKKMLDHATAKLGISMRGYFKILRVARTIADLGGAEGISMPHLVEALGYRTLDKRR